MKKNPSIKVSKPKPFTKEDFMKSEMFKALSGKILDKACEQKIDLVIGYRIQDQIQWHTNNANNPARPFLIASTMANQLQSQLQNKIKKGAENGKSKD